VLFLLGVLALAGAATPAPSIASKRAEAQQVLAQIQQIDADLGHAVEAYNAAQIELDRILAEERLNERRLKIARANFSQAQANLDERLVELYVSGETDLIEVLLGASSLDELLTRIDTASRVSDQDARIIKEVRTFRAEIKRREAELRAARAEQERVVAERAARRQEIEAKLAERRRLLTSIESEIAELEAAERERQRRLEAQARDRLAAQSSTGGGGGSGGRGSGGGGSGGGGSGGGGGGGATASPPPAQYGGVVGIAMRYLGTPYRWGGASPATGFDCSGFVMYVFAQVGVSLPHNAAMQYSYGSPVSRTQLQPGDLVFFNGLGHNGIYIGGNQFIHSPHTGDVVKISTITGWYASTYYGARRL
jgi:peptidoglycan DL-endopeptidase CwlO